MDEFVKVIRDLFKEDPGAIQAETEFRNLEEWSSMQALLVIAAVDEHFGVTLPDQEFRNANTIADLHSITVRISENE